ncbi:MAG: outer membrane protein, partial [Rhizobiaceae bacterium]
LFTALAPGGVSIPCGFLGAFPFASMLPVARVALGLDALFVAPLRVRPFPYPTAGTSSGSTDINWQGSVRAKVGYDMGQYLPYVTAGVAFADVDYGGGPLGGPCCGYSSTAVGWTAGAGMNVAITEAIFGGFEYRYTDFGTESGGLAPTFPTVIMPVDLQTHTFRVSLSVKLDSLFGQ